MSNFFQKKNRPSSISGRRLVFISLFFLFTLNLFPQNYKIGHETLTIIDPSRENREIQIEIYYPVLKAGFADSSQAKNLEKFPVICFGHGFLMPVKAYQNIVNAIVPVGYILLLPKTEGGMAPSHRDMADDMLFTLETFYTLSMDTSSLFFNKADSMNCMMGHSMGGGAAILATEKSIFIRSLIVFAPLDTRPSAVRAAGGISIPVLLFDGSKDCITPPEKHQKPIFESLNSKNKTYISIMGGTHCQMASENFLCNLAENRCETYSTISREEQHAIMNFYMIRWLNFILKEDIQSGIEFDKRIDDDPSISINKTGSLTGN